MALTNFRAQTTRSALLPFGRMAVWLSESPARIAPARTSNPVTEWLIVKTDIHGADSWSPVSRVTQIPRIRPLRVTLFALGGAGISWLIPL